MNRQERNELKELVLAFSSDDIGVVAHFTQVVNGTIESIRLTSPAITEADNLSVSISGIGTQETLATITVGTSELTTTVYPFAYMHDANGITGSPFVFTKRVVNGQMFFNEGTSDPNVNYTAVVRYY